MSLAKDVPNGLKDCKCKKMTWRERPPIPYVPEKDNVHDTVSFFKGNHLKTLINEGTELPVPIWDSGTRKAFLIHMGSSQEAIKKKGHFKYYKEYSRTFAEKAREDQGTKKPVNGTERNFWNFRWNFGSNWNF